MAYIKLFLFCYFFCLTSCYSQSHVTNSNQIQLGEKLLIGEVIKNDTRVLIDKDNFITEINKVFFKGQVIIDNLQINADYSIGDKKIKYYYLSLTSSNRSVTIVRWLFNYNGKLFIDNVPDREIFTYQDLYVTCEGNENCKPKLFELGKGFSWSCKDFVGCQPGEEPVPCKQSNTGI